MFEGWDVPQVAWAFAEKTEAEKEILREEISDAIKRGLKHENAGCDEAGLPPYPWTSMLTCKCPEGATTRASHPGCCRWRVVRPFLVQYRCDTYVHYRRDGRPEELARDPAQPGPLGTMMYVEVVKLEWNTSPDAPPPDDPSDDCRPRERKRPGAAEAGGPAEGKRQRREGEGKEG